MQSSGIETLTWRGVARFYLLVYISGFEVFFDAVHWNSFEIFNRTAHSRSKQGSHVLRNTGHLCDDRDMVLLPN